MKILDATCGCKGIWYQKNHPYVTFIDIRNGKYTYYDKHIRKGKKNQTFTANVHPDIIADWTKTLPFPDNYFDMIVFDPPHKIENRTSKESKLNIQYGRLFSDNWKQMLSKGINELFRVLKQDGVFILKWCESSKPVNEVLSLFPYQPLFGTKTGYRSPTHWIAFLKFNVNKHIME